MSNLALSLDDIHAASRRICGYVKTTPMLESSALNQALGFRLLVKAESLQHTNSFKVRGAFNQLLQLTDEEKSRGVVAISSGNHAQAVAYAAKMLGTHATIIMPQDAPRSKMEGTKSHGPTIITYNRETDDREKIGAELAENHGLYLVHPYNDFRTIAGQGTLGLEIHNQTKALGLEPHAIIVNCGGGGMLSGIAITRDLYDMPPALFTAEPEGFDDARESLATGVMARNERNTGSICDGLMAESIGDKALPILLHHKAKGFAVCDSTIEEGMWIAHSYFDLKLEPSGAVALASAYANRYLFKNKTVVVVASGGNVDPESHALMVRRGIKGRDRLLCAGIA